MPSTCVYPAPANSHSRVATCSEAIVALVCDLLAAAYECLHQWMVQGHQKSVPAVVVLEYGEIFTVRAHPEKVAGSTGQKRKPSRNKVAQTPKHMHLNFMNAFPPLQCDLFRNKVEKSSVAGRKPEVRKPSTTAPPWLGGSGACCLGSAST